MEKTGDTPFVMEELSIKIEDGVFLPNGALNQLRREALAELQKEMLKPYQRQEHPQKTAGEKFPEACEKREKRKERVFAVTRGAQTACTGSGKFLCDFCLSGHGSL